MTFVTIRGGETKWIHEHDCVCFGFQNYWAMLKSRLSRYLIVCLFPQFCDRMLGPGQHRQSQLCALESRSWSQLCSLWISGTWSTALRLIRMSPIWRLYCLSSYPPSWHSLLFVWCLMLWLESGCAEVNVSKWRCLNNKGPVRNGFVLTIRLCAQASFTKKKELSQRVSLARVAACCSPEHCSERSAGLLLIRSWFCKY